MSQIVYGALSSIVSCFWKSRVPFQICTSLVVELLTQYSIFKLVKVVAPVFFMIIFGLPQVGFILENFTLLVGDIMSITEASRLWFGAL